jgi:2-polyprenyl-3-methyl-5-hydroxy-6-metoxy-1,4-benzoquinol methylase
MEEEHVSQQLVRRACPLCSGTAASDFLSKGILTLVRCDRCSMVYANPVDAELASGSFYDDRGVAYYLSPDKLAGDYSPVRFQRELGLFRTYCKSGAVLDVGCSTGGFLHQLNTQFPGCYRVTGTDVTGAALDHAESQGIEVVRSPFLAAEFRGRRFDAITFWAVMEHLVDPGRFLERAGSLVKPGGHCFVLVPNLKSAAIRILGAKYRYIMPDHVNYFTATTLRRFGASTKDFDVVHLGSTHFNPIVILKDLRGGSERVPDEERAKLLKRTTAYKRSPWMTPLKWGYRMTERVLAGANLADNLFVVLRKRGDS